MVPAFSGVAELLLRAQEDSGIQLVASVELDGYLAKVSENADSIIWYSRGKPCGLVAFYCNDPEKNMAFLTMLVIDPERSREGMGRIILMAAIDAVRAKSFRKLYLRVNSGNDAAISLYSKCGFAISGEDANFKVMELDL